MSKFSYEVIANCGVISKVGSATKEVNIISFNGDVAKFDIRTWIDFGGVRKMSKGITLTATELRTLKNILDEMSKEPDIEEPLLGEAGADADEVNEDEDNR